MGNPGNSSRDKLISIILPTIRPDLAGAALQSIVACSDDVRYEIVVVSPFPVQGKNIVHVKEEVPKGNCAAHAMGYQASSGDIIVAMSDDHIALDGWLTPVQSFIEQRETQYFPFCAGINRPQSPWFGAVYGLYYPYFPVLSRQSAEAIGGFFSPDFTAHFGDPDLAMRVWKAGGGEMRTAVRSQSCAEQAGADIKGIGPQAYLAGKGPGDLHGPLPSRFRPGVQP
ncbi:MAG: glycosyltransferase family 2 protein [Alphaproteobacteria bacterium]|nr:glycosyltransferase family 2 protein [Alphaproteobacteria bacterium]